MEVAGGALSLPAADVLNKLLPPSPPMLPSDELPPELWPAEAPPPSCARPNESFPGAMAVRGLAPPEELVATSGFLERSKEKVVAVTVLLEACSLAPRAPVAAPSAGGRRGREGCCCCCCCESGGARLVLVVLRDDDCSPNTPMAGREEDAGVRKEEEEVVLVGALLLARLTAAGASDG